jgi:hypothetical protein
MMKDTKNIAARKLKKHSKIGDQTAQNLKTNMDSVREPIPSKIFCAPSFMTTGRKGREGQNTNFEKY